jgi:hypothetical protein
MEKAPNAIPKDQPCCDLDREEWCTCENVTRRLRLAVECSNNRECGSGNDDPDSVGAEQLVQHCK